MSIYVFTIMTKLNFDKEYCRWIVESGLHILGLMLFYLI